MALNYPGPYEIRIPYLTSNITPGGVLTHEMRLNVDLQGTPAQAQDFDQYTVICKGGATPQLDSVVEDWLAVLDDLLNNGFSFGAIELWKYPTAQSFDAVFWATYNPTINAGASGSGAQPASQVIWTFRSEEGGTMKVSLLETIVVQSQKIAYANQTAAQQAVVDYVLGGGVGYGAPFKARDTSYPVGGGTLFPGQNEATFKQRYRQ